MIKAIIFDFDGVIVESADIKTEAFKELFSDYPQKIKEIINYHLLNGGISRYVKFRYIYEQILGQELSRDAEVELGRCFAQIVLQKVLKAPFVAGAKEFLDTCRTKYQFFIASGTPEEELRSIIHLRGLQKYFKEIQGSPRQKADIIKGILNRYNLAKREAVYVGDASSDRIAAEQAQITFIERNPNLNTKKNGNLRIKDFFNFHKIIEVINDK